MKKPQVENNTTVKVSTTFDECMADINLCLMFRNANFGDKAKLILPSGMIVTAKEIVR